MKYKVHIGYTKTGRNRWLKFPSLRAAENFCAEIFAKTKTILTIESVE